MIYLDHAATTPVKEEVIKAMQPYLQDHFGNPGSIHTTGIRAKAAMEYARRQVAECFDCDPYQVIFTPSGTYANNLAILGLENTLRDMNKTHIIASACEHKSVLAPLKELENRGFDVTYVVGEESRITWNDIAPHLRRSTGLVVAMGVNNETGVVSDFLTIGQKCFDLQIFYHMDAVQTAGVLQLYFHQMRGISSFSVSGHKIGAPKGCGCLIVRNPAELRPLIIGGGQEMGLCAGTENVPAIVGLGAACSHLDIFRGVYPSLFVSELARLADAKLNTSIDHLLWKVVSLYVPDVDAESLIIALSAKGVCVSAGAACDSKRSEPSHVLTAMGLSEERSRQSIRISFSNNRSFDEYEQALTIIAETIYQLRQLKQNKHTEDA